MHTSARTLSALARSACTDPTPFLRLFFLLFAIFWALEMVELLKHHPFSSAKRDCEDPLPAAVSGVSPGLDATETEPILGTEPDKTDEELIADIDALLLSLAGLGPLKLFLEREALEAEGSGEKVDESRHELKPEALQEDSSADALETKVISPPSPATSNASALPDTPDMAYLVRWASDLAVKTYNDDRAEVELGSASDHNDDDCAYDADDEHYIVWFHRRRV